MKQQMNPHNRQKQIILALLQKILMITDSDTSHSRGLTAVKRGMKAVQNLKFNDVFMSHALRKFNVQSSHKVSLEDLISGCIF